MRGEGKVGGSEHRKNRAPVSEKEVDGHASRRNAVRYERMAHGIVGGSPMRIEGWVVGSGRCVPRLYSNTGQTSSPCMC